MRSALAVEAKRVLINVTTGNAAFGPAVCSRAKEWVAYAEWSVGTTAGVVTVESAPYEGYLGTWQSLGTLTWTAADRADELNFTGFHLAIRFRVSTTVTGGTVTVWAGGRM